MDTTLQVRSRAYATGPDFRLTYLFLRCLGIGPILARKQFLNINIHVLVLGLLTMGLVPNWHERSAFQSVAVQAVDWHDNSGPLFSLFFSTTTSSSPPQPFLIEGVLRSENLFNES